MYINAGVGRYYKFYGHHWSTGDFIAKYEQLVDELNKK